ncbi:PKD domain-containing protein [candidate division KSB1 bacterium]|nr:PKD domain-containing protein [candidate division KSB1 bacterium]
MQKLFSTVLVAFMALAGGVPAQTFGLKHPLKSPEPGESYNFGAAVAAVGNNVLVGEPKSANGGTAYLFDGITSARLLTFPNPTQVSFEEFGRAVAAVGNNVLIAAPLTNGGAGAAYLFDGSTGARLLTFTNPSSTLDKFGFSVAGVGSHVLIGAPSANGGAGAAYLFDGATGDLLRTFTIPSPTIMDQFGYAVAGVGSHVLIGAPGHSSGTGAAYLFDGSTGALLQKFTDPFPSNSDQFGSAVAGLGNNVLVGALFGDTPGTEDNIGAAYLYDGTAGGLPQIFLNPGPPPSASEQFGFSVAAFGSNILIVVGAPFDNQGATAAGAAYLFDGSTGSLLQTIFNPTPGIGDQFGFAVAAAGNNLIIGAPADDDAGASDAGSAYLYSPGNQPPVADAGADQNVECTSPVETLVTLDGSASTDPDNDQLTYTWWENGSMIAGPTNNATSQMTLALGSHTIKLTVDDGKGGTGTDEVIINVVDTTPPTITLLAPLTLWPANRKYNTISVTQCVASVSDACGGSIPASQVKIAAVSSDEPVDALDHDIVIAGDCQSVDLRADRDKQGNGRVYTIELTVTDLSGNVATASYTVAVPASNNQAAVDDGPVYTEISNCEGAAITKTSNGSEDGEANEMTDIAAPESYALAQNYPNPFNPETKIRFALPEASHVTVKIFNTLGENIRTLADGDFAPGTHALRWNARNERGAKVPSGIYFYQLVTPRFSETKRMILAK